MANTRAVREFVYLDVPRLYSFYSQVFEGITEQVMRERINKLITGDTQSTVLGRATAESQGTEASRHVETIVLHDHMYNQLETELEPTLVSQSEVGADKIIEELTRNPMIKVSGRSEVEDYQRISVFFDELNRLGEAVAYASISSSPETLTKIEALRLQAERAQTKGQRNEVKKKTEALTDPKLAAEALGLRQDKRLLENLKFMGNLFNPSGYDIVITPKNKPNMHYRGVLNRSWLRDEPQAISNLYGGQSEALWSMVGIVTNLPGTYHAHSQAETQVEQESTKGSTQEDEDNPMMLDYYRNMFRTARVFERMFLESKTDIEIVVSPLAIYREFEVKTKKDRTNST